MKMSAQVSGSQYVTLEFSHEDVVRTIAASQATNWERGWRIVRWWATNEGPLTDNSKIRIEMRRAFP